jgi:hypothetical protein
MVAGKRLVWKTAAAMFAGANDCQNTFGAMPQGNGASSNRRQPVRMVGDLSHL